MKAFSTKSILILCTAVLLLACNKDDNPAPAPVPTPDPEMHPVAQVLEGNYWQEKICFTYKEIGPEANTVMVTDDIMCETSSGGSYFNLRLDKFYVDSETGKLRSFDYTNNYIGNWYYENKYKFEYPDQEHIRIFTQDELSSFFGAAFNIDLQVRACTDKEIILDGPIKSYVWQNWNLENRAVMYLGIRVYWTKIENGAEILEPSSPLD